MHPAERRQAIVERLNDRFQPLFLEVHDNSAAHAGHEGAVNGGGYFRVVIVADAFRGTSRVAAQRKVFAALDDLMTSDIHALEMRTFSPEQWNQRA
jgi:BolA protein